MPSFVLKPVLAPVLASLIKTSRYQFAFRLQFAGEFFHPVVLDGEPTCFTFVGEFDNLQTGLRSLLSSACFSSAFSVS